jgi:outer membrane murein-binding lipoprotein Lpp
MSPRQAAARPLTSTSPAPARRPSLTALPGGAADRSARSRLEAVRAPLQVRSRVPFLILCMSILGFALLGALVLNTTMAKGSYQISDLRTEAGVLEQDTQALTSQLQAAKTSLPDRARALGMVESDAPTMLRLADGTIVGAPEAGSAP